MFAPIHVDWVTSSMIENYDNLIQFMSYLCLKEQGSCYLSYTKSGYPQLASSADLPPEIQWHWRNSAVRCADVENALGETWNDWNDVISMQHTMVKSIWKKMKHEMKSFGICWNWIQQKKKKKKKKNTHGRPRKHPEFRCRFSRKAARPFTWTPEIARCRCLAIWSWNELNELTFLVGGNWLPSILFSH